MTSPLLPPYTPETATLKVRAAEDAWNTRDPQHVSQAYTADSRWRNRDLFLTGHQAILRFLTEKWEREREYRLVKELWGNAKNRMAVRFVYESQTLGGAWYRSFGNELWEFSEDGLMQRREASINDIRIQESDRLFHWPLGPRPTDHPGLTELGF